MHGDATESWRKQGDVWVVSEGDRDYGPTMFTLGYDTDSKRFVGSFVTALMTYFWTYEGQLEGAEKLVLFAKGPSMGPEGGFANYRDEIELFGEGDRVLRSFVEQADGSWLQFMQARYSRR